MSRMSIAKALMVAGAVLVASCASGSFVFPCITFKNGSVGCDGASTQSQAVASQGDGAVNGQSVAQPI